MMLTLKTLLILITTLECDTLDVEDYTFYFNSYHYEIENIKNTENDTNELLLHNKNIKIQLINTSFILNDNIKLDWQLDANWNEVSYVYRYQHDIQKRGLLDDFDYTAWNKFDHTTEHHIKLGRFIGEKGYKRKFIDASAMCHEYYAELASIRDAFEQATVQKLCSQLGDGSCWIGLQAEQKSKNWANTKNWIDGHPLAYKNWSPGEPNNAGGREYCAEIYKNGRWNDLPCDRERYAICEKVSEHFIGDYVGVYKEASWFKANLYCKMKYGSELAIIRSYWQQRDAQAACNSIGNNFGKKQDCWIGFKKKSGILWEWWHNKAIVSYRNWGVGFPQDNYEKKCVFLDSQQTSGVWENEECSQQKWFICNAKEQTPSMEIKDLLFPPTTHDERRKYALLKAQQKSEIAEKKMEQEFAKLKNAQYTDKISKTDEDRAEYRQDNHHNVHGHHWSHHLYGQSQPRPYAPLHKPHPGGVYKTDEDRAEFRMDNHPRAQHPQRPLYPNQPHDIPIPQPMFQFPQQPQRPMSNHQLHGMPLQELKAGSTGSNGHVQRYARMKQRLDRLEGRLNIMGTSQHKHEHKHKHKHESNSMPGDNTQGLDQLDVKNMMHSLLKSMRGQPGQGNLNNMANQNYFTHPFGAKGYDPHKDPYFGGMNLRSAMGKGYHGHVGGSLHPPSGHENDPYFGRMNHGHVGGSLRPPSGHKNDPYGFNGGGDTSYNPQFYPHTQLAGPYASAAKQMDFDSDGGSLRRRLGLLHGEGMYNEIEKCRFGSNFEFCIQYGKDNKMTLEVIVADKKIMKPGDDEVSMRRRYHVKGMTDIARNLGYNIWKYEQLDYKKRFTDDDYVHYFDKIELLFEFNPYKISHRLCQHNNDALAFNICLKKDTKNKKETEIVLFVENVLDDKKFDISQIEIKTFDFGNYNEWDEIYMNIDKKCVNLVNAKVCVMPIVDKTDYMVEIKVYKSLTKQS